MLVKLSAKSIIVLVTIDSLRYDALSCNRALSSYSTPFIDNLASNGIKFDNAFSHGGQTPDSFPSIMCSSPPPWIPTDRIVKNKKKLSEILKDRGFTTAGFHDNPYLTSQFGYGDGFDNFFEGRYAHSKQGYLKNDWDLMVLNKHPSADCWEIAKQANRWIKGLSEPTFLWLHFMDAHVPYLPPTLSFGLANSVKLRVFWETWYRWYSKIWYNGGRGASPTVQKLVRLAYQRSVQEVDECLSRLFSNIRKFYDEHLILLTADHGEGFWENNGHFGHVAVFDSILHVPLIISGNGIPKGIQSSNLVSLSDILPTITAYLGDAGTQSFFGKDILNSDSLSNYSGQVISTCLDTAAQRRTVAVRSLNHKYVRQEAMNGSKPISEQFFDLISDPKEAHNIVSHDDVRVQEAMNTIDLVLRRNTTDTEFSLSKEEENELERRLSALGYC